jgi:hypothetical protein
MRIYDHPKSFDPAESRVTLKEVIEMILIVVGIVIVAELWFLL